MEPIIWITFVFGLISVNPMKFSVCCSLVCLSMTEWNANIIFKIDQNLYVVIFCFTYESTEQHSHLGKKL